MQNNMKMYAKVWIIKILLIFTHSKCVRHTCRFCNWSLFTIVSKSVDVRNIAHSHTCEICAMPMQVLQLEFFITALLPTAKIQESPFAFAYLPTYKITKTALKEIVLSIKINFNLILNFDSNSFDWILLLFQSYCLDLYRAKILTIFVHILVETTTS